MSDKIEPMDGEHEQFLYEKGIQPEQGLSTVILFCIIIAVTIFTLKYLI